ncbi:unnamed protein product, partial [marine sediment metagenome]
MGEKSETCEIKGETFTYRGHSDIFKERQRGTKQIVERERLQRWPGAPFQPTPTAYKEGLPFKIPSGLLDRPKAKVNVPVAIIKCSDYAFAESAVRQAIDYIGGPEVICNKGDKVLVKPNLVFPNHPWMTETTHPSVVAALVKILKERGATVWVGEQAAWHASADVAYDVTGIRKAAEEAGADEVINWENPPRVKVEIPGGRTFSSIEVHKSVLDCDVFCTIPTMKNNFVSGPWGMTLCMKR